MIGAPKTAISGEKYRVSVARAMGLSVLDATHRSVAVVVDDSGCSRAVPWYPNNDLDATSVLLWLLSRGYRVVLWELGGRSWADVQRQDTKEAWRCPGDSWRQALCDCLLAMKGVEE